MRFSLSEDQLSIQSTAREFLAARYPFSEVRRLALEEERGFTDEQWSEMVELGWPGLAIPEEHGGLGLGMVELAVLAEELGYAVAPTPLPSSWATAQLVGPVFLERLAGGGERGAAASFHDEADGSWLVADADAAALIVLGDRVISRDEADVERVDALDHTRRLYRVRAADDAGEPSGEHDHADGLARIAVQTAAETVGIAQRAMEMAVEYAKDRKQFGRPIGTYQAVSHACAQMLLEVEGARSLVYFAAWALEHSRDEAPLAAAAAAAYAGDAGTRVTGSSLQVHGGIGFTWEHDLHFLLKRAQSNARGVLRPSERRAEVAALIGL